MRLKVCGAAQEVTGSNYLIESAGHRVIVDCGMHQGGNEELDRQPFPYAPASIEAVLLTHAHIDHSGRLPLLVKQGFRGKIYATLPTIELTEILWEDTAKLMKEEAEMQSRKNARRGLPAVEPLFNLEDVNRASARFIPVSYDERFEVVPGIHVRFRDAGHILGSAILEFGLVEDSKIVRLVFSGDLGPQKTVMEREPAEISDADYVVIESTYGNREHKGNAETREEFQSLMKEILVNRSKVYIPTFVVDRAQRVMYELALLKEQGIGKELPVYFDSPMGVRATKFYEAHMDLMSQELQAYRLRGGQPFSPENLHYITSVEESQAVNREKFGIVLAGSGMCNGGRILHHLKNGIWDPNNHLVFVGYQAQGTLGRLIVNGTKTVRILGELVSVKAKIHTIGGFSAHGDRTDLLSWAERFRLSMPKFFVTHGEPEASQSLVDALCQRGFESLAPLREQEFELIPRSAGERTAGAIRDAQAAPTVAPLPETPVAASDKAADVDLKPAIEKPAAVPEEAPKAKVDPQLINSFQRIGDLMQEVYDRGSSGSIGLEGKPLLDSVEILLKTLLQKKV